MRQNTPYSRASGRNDASDKLDSTKCHAQQKLERTLQNELNIIGSSNQVLLLMVPTCLESNFNRKVRHSSSVCTMDNSPVRSCLAAGCGWELYAFTLGAHSSTRSPGSP